MKATYRKNQQCEGCGRLIADHNASQHCKDCKVWVQKQEVRSEKLAEVRGEDECFRLPSKARKEAPRG